MSQTKKQAKKTKKPTRIPDDMEEPDEISEEVVLPEDLDEEVNNNNEETEDAEEKTSEPVIEVWPKLLSDFTFHVNKAISTLRDRDVEDIPGAKEELIARLTNLLNYFPKNDGVILKKIVSDSIERSFFPRTDDISQAFNQILNARTPDQDYIIQEALNGFVASETNLTAASREGTLIDRLVELFRKSSNFSIIEHQFYNMFGNPNKPRKFLKEGFQKLVSIFGLEKDKLIIEKDKRTSQQREIIFYRFPVEVLAVLNGRFIQVYPDTGEIVVLPNFDKLVFISLFLANLAANRIKLSKYMINGICNIFALIIILSFMPPLKLDPSNPIFKQGNFDPARMSVIPKSWLMPNVLIEIFPTLVAIVAYLHGGKQWYGKIELTEARIKIHNQTMFLLKDVNKWVLGNLCRVEIPIFVEIANIFQTITVGLESNTEKKP